MNGAGEWLKTNLRIGALSFGSSGRAMLYQEDVVDRKKWLSEDEFFEVLTVAQLLPGPNLVNLAAYLSRRIFPARWWLPVPAVLALAIPGALFAVAMVAFLDMENAWIRLLFQGFSLGSVAVFLVFVRRLLGNVWVGAGWKRGARLLVAFAVGGMSLTGVPLPWILAAGIALGIMVEFSG
ncbi:MAG: chromate transporter [Bdellovibrionales bacterium]|nr:chromate transporter [Bdellovibrionales bacterium]